MHSNGYNDNHQTKVGPSKTSLQEGDTAITTIHNCVHARIDEFVEDSMDDTNDGRMDVTNPMPSNDEMDDNNHNATVISSTTSTSAFSPNNL